MTYVTLSNAFKIALGLFFIVILTPHTYAFSNPQAVTVSVDSFGTVTGWSSAVCSDTQPTLYGFMLVSGNTPTTSNQITSIQNANYVCYVLENAGFATIMSSLTNPTTTLSDGTYTMIVTTGGYAYSPNFDVGTQYYFTVTKLNGLWSSSGTPTPTPTTTKNIDIITPEYGTTTGTSTQIQIKYKTPFTIDIRPTTTRKFVIRDAVSLLTEYVYDETLPANSSENVTITENVTLTNGSKLIFAYYETENGAIYSEVDESFFNVNINTYELATGLIDPSQTPTETQNDCELYNIGCQFQKALLFLFKPSSDILNKFTNIWETIKTKKPFGYVTVTIQQLTSLDTNSTHTFDLGTVPFQTAIFDPFKIALGSILWALYAIFFYQRRLKHLDI